MRPRKRGTPTTQAHANLKSMFDSGLIRRSSAFTRSGCLNLTGTSNHTLDIAPLDARAGTHHDADGARMPVYPELKNRVVLVTGGANGIGAAIVFAFRQQQARVFFC